MTINQTSRDSEVISLRTSRDFKDRLREWADARALPMSKLLEEMGELYARAEAGSERKLSAVELLLRPHVGALEREMTKAFEEAEARAALFREEAEALKAALERSEARVKEERLAWEAERKSLQEALEKAERSLTEERTLRESAERQAREATETARALTTSLGDARIRLEDLQVQLANLPALRKERDELAAESHRLALERENTELTLARVREDLIREKDASKRCEETYMRELLALERECDARVSRVEFEAERSLFQKTTDLERQIQNLKSEFARREEG